MAALKHENKEKKEINKKDRHAQTLNRTMDLLFTREMLYRLSYLGNYA